MRFLLLVKANADSEAGVMPSTEELTEMGRYNERLAEAGVLLAGEGLHPSSKGARIQFSPAGDSSVADGPFGQPQSLVAGYWVIQAASRDEAIEWVRQAPFKGGEVEIRQIFEADDFGDALTPELREQEDRLREQEARLNAG